MNTPKVPNELIERIRNKECAIFVGSGISRSSGIPTWSDLLRKLLDIYFDKEPKEHTYKELSSMIDSGRLIDVAEYIKLVMKPRAFRDAMMRILDSEDISPTDIHYSLARIPFTAVVTTNYDHLLEDTYLDVFGSRYGRPYSYNNLSALGSLASEKSFFILKAHGSVDDIENIVFSRTDYQQVMINFPSYRTFLYSLLSSRTFLFLGYSLTDPDLAIILDDLAAIFQGFGQVHYILLPNCDGLDKTLFERRFNLEVINYQPSETNHPEVFDFIHSIDQYFLEEKITLKAETLNQQNAQKMGLISEILAGVTHNYNNILSGIMGYAYILSNTLSTDDPNMRYLEKIVSGCRRATSLTKRLSMLDQNLPIDYKIISLSKLVKETVDGFVTTLDQTIKIDVELDEDCVIEGDTDQVQQIVTNLMTNSIEAMDWGGKIHVSVYKIVISEMLSGVIKPIIPGPYIILEISDSGTGIEEEDINKIFSPDYSTKPTGEGFGLSIVYNITKRHNANISIISHINEGTVVKLYFPHIDGKPIESNSLLDKGVTINGNGERILIIDDEEDQIETMASVLTTAGYSAVGLSDGEEAISYIQENHNDIDLLVLDMVMSNVSGEKILELLHDINPEKKVLIISGYSREFWSHILGNPRIDFLQKPFEPTQLLPAIANLLYRKKNPTRINNTGQEIITTNDFSFSEEGPSKYTSQVENNSQSENFASLETTGVSDIIIDTDSLLRTMFDSIAEGIVITDLGLNIIHSNSTINHILGHEKEAELIGKNFRQLVSEREQYLFDDITFDEGNEQYIFRESSLVNEDNSEFTAEISITPFHNHIKNIQGFVFVLRDTSERTKLLEQLVVTDRLASIGELAAGIAHEINNPLTGVIGFSDLLSSRQDVPDDIKEDLIVINREAIRASQIARNMLTFARKHPNEKSPVDINEIINICLDLRSYEMKVNNIEVETNTTDYPLWVLGNDFQLQQVLLNIIINSEYFMLDSHGYGKLIIKTQKRDDVIEISIIDDGPGIPKEYLPNIFNPFFTTKEVGKGTGLGLSISYGIISEHNGTIRADNVKGGGARFIISLPASEGPVKVSKSKDKPTTIKNLKNKRKLQQRRVLVLDDEPFIREFVERTLSKIGLKVFTASNTNEAIDLINSNDFDIYLFDVVLPGMSGIDLFNKLVSERPDISSNIVFMTGANLRSNVSEFFEEHNIQFLAKPFNEEELYAILFSLL
ncbi:MAG: response regulator [Dehalococcoidales bacterium]|nr:response regulator [Dehalococcoidales bacterium]